MSTSKKNVGYMMIVVLGLMGGSIARAQEKNQSNTTQPQVTDVTIAGKNQSEKRDEEPQDSIKKKELDEVMVVGYVTGTPKTISGSVDKIGRAEMNTGVVNNPLNNIKGKVAGVNIQSVGGDPTVTPSIRIRGTTSLSGGNDPLVVIDGVFADLSLLNAISPSDIESYTILKDASETAQYGSRGASGVIVVTTVKGKAGVTNVTYEGLFGVETVYKNINMMNASQYLQAVSNAGITNALNGGSSTDFIKQMERTGFTQNHRLSFGSGNDRANYRASFGYIGQQGVIKTSDMQNYTAKFDASQKMFQNKLRIDLGIFASRRQNRYINDYQKTFYSAAAFNPTLPAAQNADGSWPEDPNANEVDNPLGRLTIQDVSKNTWVNAHARLTYNIIEDLSISAFGSYSYNGQVSSLYIPNNIKAGIRATNGQGSQSLSESSISMGNINLNYKKNFDKHFIDVLALAELQQYDYSGFNATARSFDVNTLGYNNLAAGAIVKYGDVGSYANQNRIASFLGRVNYVYDGKYIATVNARGDGSSKLGNNNKWGFFPSGSVAWVMSNESFLKNIKQITNLKIRLGYGVTGNQDAISAYNSLPLMVPTGITTINGVSTVTYGYARNANPDLRWETKAMWDAGVDVSLFDSRLNLTVDYYNSKTKGLLYNYAVPVPPFVYPTLLANLGAMQNNGVEIAISGTPVKIKDFELTLSANITYQQNKLLSLSGTYQGQNLSAPQYMSLGGMNGAGFIGGNNQVVYQMVGQPVGVFYLPHSRGLVNNGLGSYAYDVQDLNGDGTVDINNGQDRKIAGQAMPKVLLGFNLGMKYKNFDLQAQLTGAFGQKIYNGTSLSYMNMNNFPTYNVLPQAPAQNIKDQTVTDYWLEKGDYVHIEYITIGYTVNTQKFNKWVKGIRVAVSVNNLYTFTGYTGLSPMINNSVVNSDLGIDDKRFYPLTRTYSLSINLNF